MIDRGELARKAAMNAIRFSGLPHIAGPVFSGIGAILMMHRITNTPGTPLGLNCHLSITPEFLDTTITLVRDMEYDLVTIDEAVRRIRGSRHNRPFAAITLDDGYRDNLVEALPVFEKHCAPFTLFIAPGLIDGNTVLWWDTLEEIVTKQGSVELAGTGGKLVLDCNSANRKAYSNCVATEYLTKTIPELERSNAVRKLAEVNGIDPDEHMRNVLMDWDEIAQIAAHPLCTIGAHSMNHLNLARLDLDGARNEIEMGRSTLEDRLGIEVRHMAYPYGSAEAAGAREVKLAANAGFDSAVTTRHGVIHPEHASHLHVLPRISINGRYQNRKYIRTMLSGLTGVVANRGKRVTTY